LRALVRDEPAMRRATLAAGAERVVREGCNVEEVLAGAAALPRSL
jgi:hypothetical protein